MKHHSPIALSLIVVYNNAEEATQFIEHLQDEIETGALDIAICDNSSTSLKSSLPAGFSYIHRPDNPGYLDGGIAALDEWRRQGNTMPPWTILTNTDLEFREEPITSVLRDHDARIPQVIAPRVVEGAGQVEKNPHLLWPRTSRRHQLNHLLTLTPTVALGYLTASALKQRFRPQVAAPERQESAPPGTRMYSPYGAIMCFSQALLDRAALPVGVPLLAEEWAIAEMAAAAGAPIVFEPRICAIHDAHQTTGPGVSRNRAKMLSRAFTYIRQNAGK